MKTGVIYVVGHGRIRKDKDGKTRDAFSTVYGETYFIKELMCNGDKRLKNKNFYYIVDACRKDDDNGCKYDTTSPEVNEVIAFGGRYDDVTWHNADGNYYIKEIIRILENPLTLNLELNLKNVLISASNSVVQRHNGLQRPQIIFGGAMHMNCDDTINVQENRENDMSGRCF